jgi:large subunit ribosomal protein L10
MAVSRSKKNTQLKTLEDKFRSATGVAFVQFDKATVTEVEQVRKELKSKGMSYTVVKKTLIALAAKNTGKAEFNPDLLEGSVAVIISSSDELMPVAEIKKMRKEFLNKRTKVSKFDFSGAIFEGRLLSKVEAMQLADIPSREESLAKIVGMLLSGPQKLHGILGSGLRGIHNVLKEAEKFTTSS